MRSLLVILSLLIYFIVFLPAMVVLLLLRKSHYALSMHVSRHLVRGIIGVMLFFSGTRITREGIDNIPDEPVLFVADHRSYYDTFVIYMCSPRPTGFVAKKELESIPLLSHWMTLMGCVFLDRTNVKEGLRSILLAIDIVKHGYSMVIFPEGTRNRGEDIDTPLEFKEGSLQIAKKTHCPIVPVAIKNSENCLETHFPWVRKNTLRITFLRAFYLEDIPPEEKKFPARYVRSLICRELERPLQKF